MPKLMQVALLAVVACEIFTNGAFDSARACHVQLSKFLMTVFSLIFRPVSYRTAKPVG